nr:MAG TPA: hypothetical protein [Caudoviricetes sp.]
MVLDSNRPIIKIGSEAIRVWLLFRVVLVVDALDRTGVYSITNLKSVYLSPKAFERVQQHH